MGRFRKQFEIRIFQNVPTYYCLICIMWKLFKYSISVGFCSMRENCQPLEKLYNSTAKHKPKLGRALRFCLSLLFCLENDKNQVGKDKVQETKKCKLQGIYSTYVAGKISCKLFMQDRETNYGKSPVLSFVSDPVGRKGSFIKI